MLYLPCNHQQLHDAGWLEETWVSIAGKEERIAIAPCRLLFARASRVHSWLATLTVVLHRKIVHEEVLQQLLTRRYGLWLGLWTTLDLMRCLPVFYQHHETRYYLLRDVVPLLPKFTIMRRRTPQRHSSNAWGVGQAVPGTLQQPTLTCTVSDAA
jgi:hypothetical protein